MKKIFAVVMCCVCCFLTACGNLSAKDYTYFNHDLYWGMSQNEADKILSEKYTTINSGNTISYDIDNSEDFLYPDKEIAVNPTIQLEFEKDKLVKITQKYTYEMLLPGSFGELFNTYLFIALKADKEEELSERYIELSDGSQALSSQAAMYCTEAENVFICAIYFPVPGAETTSITIEFEPKD
ncbi:MAG: hypothetical protein J6C96_03870 [Oscillospiraceae bacterium]|nr:hypothetical protein [Oscillospiraceae bacterium]